VKRKKQTISEIFLATMFLVVLFVISFSITFRKKTNIQISSNIPDISEINIPILMYHYVEYNKDKRDFIRDSLNVQPHVFEKQIVTLKNAGYVFITPS
jgi:hypothetical protein